MYMCVRTHMYDWHQYSLLSLLVCTNNVTLPLHISLQHGQVVIPFSALASGKLRRIINEAKGVEGMPPFTLVTSDFNVAESTDEDSLQSYSAVSNQESALYTEAFVELMNTDEFDVLERNYLLNFGIDNVGGEHGNVLYRAAYRVA